MCDPALPDWRLSRDNRRLYVTNSLLTPWDNDTDFGPARNNDYGIWRFTVRRSGGLTPFKSDGSAWVSFTDVRKKNTTGPAGPHMSSSTRASRPYPASTEDFIPEFQPQLRRAK
jgi:hypothetical protein